MEPTTVVTVHDKKKRIESVSNYDVSLIEELKRAFPLDRQTKPELIVGKSEILDFEDVDNILHHVLTADSCSWSLAYSASIHERSLEGMYKRLNYVSASGSPLVILIKDTEKHVHGVFLPKFTPDLTTEESPTGTLFHARPKFNIFQGAEKQMWSIYKTHGLLSIVDISAKCGLWVNGDLTEGKVEEYLRSSSSQPFRPGLETNSIQEHRFSVKTLECWMLSDIKCETDK